MFSSALVNLFVSKIAQYLLNRLSHNSMERYVAHGLRKKALDFGGGRIALR